MSNAIVSRILIYPLKSFPGIQVMESRVLANGALEFDRRFALQTADGACWNAKRTARIHGCPASLDPWRRTMQLHSFAGGSLSVAAGVRVDEQRDLIDGWFSEYFGEPLRLVENPRGGYPDDDNAPGPTIASELSLAAVADWFALGAIDSARQRLRTNVEVLAPEPFWEDRLIGAKSIPVRFQVGSVTFLGVNPCQRCVVPSRDPVTGLESPGFQKKFAQKRLDSLPRWAPRDRFNHGYRFSVNTELADLGEGVIRVGDPVTILGTK